MARTKSKSAVAKPAAAKSKIYEDYPASGMLLCNLMGVVIALLGAFILFPYGIHVSIIYLIYVFYLQFQIARRACPDCYYYGKTCYCGLGACSARLFKRGDPKRFAAKRFTWMDMVPSFMVSLVPIVCGIILLALKFDWTLLAAIVAMGILGFPAQGIVHGWGCRHCKQRELGCPAEKLFDVEKAGKKKAKG